MWAQALPKLEVRTDLVLRDDGRIGWAIRKDSPKLAAEIEDFHTNWAAKQGVIDYRLAQYMKRVKETEGPDRHRRVEALRARRSRCSRSTAPSTASTR